MDVPREVRIEEALTRALPRLSLRTGVHLLAMHVSGFVLLGLFLVPTPSSAALYGTVEPPALLVLAMLLTGALAHVVVQLPAALLGTLVHRHHPVRAYGTALAAAGALSGIAVAALGGGWAGWLDIMLRLALSLACYVALVRMR
ncbi:hypothetical protein ABXV03_10270 [Streptomyces harbinensis]|uniref:hypothetical protein n=1 Tax=Streptomyces harbinensis TaxID=1176198 RepID=UPI0033912C60